MIKHPTEQQLEVQLAIAMATTEGWWNPVRYGVHKKERVYHR